MNIPAASIIRVFFLWAVPALSAYAQHTSILSYADDLFARSEYYRAISEYDRYLFFQGQTHEDSIYCSLQILKCHFFGEEYNDAVEFGESFIASRFIEENKKRDFFRYIGLSYLDMGFPRSAVLYFERFPEDPKSILLSGVCNLHLHDWDKAYERFITATASPDSSFSIAGKDLARVSLEAKTLPSKSSLLAGLLSTLVPGAGYVYTKNYQTGILSLALNVLLLGSGYDLHRSGHTLTGSFFYLIGFGWYIGNIYGSYTSAIKLNETIYKKYIDESLKRYESLQQ